MALDPLEKPSGRCYSPRYHSSLLRKKAAAADAGWRPRSRQPGGWLSAVNADFRIVSLPAPVPQVQVRNRRTVPVACPGRTGQGSNLRAAFEDCFVGHTCACARCRQNALLAMTYSDNVKALFPPLPALPAGRIAAILGTGTGQIPPPGTKHLQALSGHANPSAGGLI
jgi:hypothetical protein